MLAFKHLIVELASHTMKSKINVLVLLLMSSCLACKQQNPIDFQKRLVGEWQIVDSKRKEPDLLIYPMADGGLFAYDDLSGKWRSYSAWLSDSRDTLLGRQGCTMHYSFRLSYLSEQDRLVVDDTIVLQHSRVIPRQPIR
jgi:hypothetical protein